MTRVRESIRREHDTWFGVRGNGKWTSSRRRWKGAQGRRNSRPPGPTRVRRSDARVAESTFLRPKPTNGMEACSGSCARSCVGNRDGLAPPRRLTPGKSLKLTFNVTEGYPTAWYTEGEVGIICIVMSKSPFVPAVFRSRNKGGELVTGP